MTSKLPPVTASTSTLQTAAPAISRWNTRSVAVLLGFSALAIALYAIYRHYNRPADNSPPPSPRRLPFGPTASQHTSGLKVQGQPCLNERAALPFAQFAEGIIHLQPLHFGINPGDYFNLGCYRKGETVAFCERLVQYSYGDIEVFIPNLPFGEEIEIHFGKDSQSNTLSFTVDQVHGVYSIDHTGRYAVPGEGDRFTSSSEATPAYKLSTPEAPALDLAGSYQLRFSNERPPHLDLVDSDNPLTLINLGKKTVVYLQLSNGASGIDPTATDVVLPIILNAYHTLNLTHSLLRQMWLTEYHRVTQKYFGGNVELYLAGIQQLLFAEPRQTLKEESDDDHDFQSGGHLWGVGNDDGKEIDDLFQETGNAHLETEASPRHSSDEEPTH